MKRTLWIWVILALSQAACQKSDPVPPPSSPPGRTVVGNGGSKILADFLWAAERLMDRIEATPRALEILKKRGLDTQHLRSLISPKRVRVVKSREYDKEGSLADAVATFFINLALDPWEKYFLSGIDVDQQILHELFRIYFPFVPHAAALDDGYTISAQVIAALAKTRFDVETSEGDPSGLVSLLPAQIPVVGAAGCPSSRARIFFDYRESRLWIEFSEMELQSDTWFTRFFKASALECELQFRLQPEKMAEWEISAAMVSGISSGDLLPHTQITVGELVASTARAIVSPAGGFAVPLPGFPFSEGGLLKLSTQMKLRGASTGFIGVRQLHVVFRKK